jgi:outer membrane protein assembly factor BamB
LQGIVSAPLVESNRLWFVNNRGEVVCADTEGFYDDEDDGPDQGVRGRVFTVTPKVTPATQWRYYHPAGRLLHAIAQQGGLEIPTYYRVIRERDGTQIIVQGSTKNAQRIGRLDITDDSLRISRIVAKNGEEVFEEVISVGTDLLAGIDEGRLTPALRFLLARAGTELPEQVDVRTVKPQEVWSINAEVDGVSQQFQLQIEGENLVAYKLIATTDKREADVVWKFDMMKELGVSQHNMATCCITAWGNRLFICTSNGVDEGHSRIPAPNAPSFIAMDKHTGRVLWTDNSPGKNILHGQWSAPAVAELGGVPQVIFAGGDGWLYSFRADRWKKGKPELLWKFDVNPKDSKWILGGRGTRNNIIAIPVIYDGLVYLPVGQDPEHGEGDGHLWCIDPTRRGDVSAELVVDAHGNILPHFRNQATAEWGRIFDLGERVWDGLDAGTVSPRLRSHFAKAGFELPPDVVVEGRGMQWLLSATINGHTKRFRMRATTRTPPGGVQHDFTVDLETNARAVANPNSAVVWHYGKSDGNGDGEIDFEEQFHRSLGSVAIKNDLLFVCDGAGLVHCLNAKTGRLHWTCDLLAACWVSPLIVDDKVFIGDEDGDVAIFQLSSDITKSVKKTTVTRRDGSQSWLYEAALELNMLSSIYSTPIVANDVLYIATKSHLFAIAFPEEN